MLLKRLLDIFGATVGLVVFAPVMLVIACMIRWQMGSPILFRQVRPGKDGAPFEMLKFRTMRDATDASGTPLDDAVGSISSLD